MYAAEVACDCNAGYIFSMESEHARSLRTEPCRSFGGGYISMQMLMLTVICSDDLCQQAGYHLNNISDRHPTDLVLLPAIHPPSQRMPGRVARSRKNFLASKALYMAKVSDLDAAGRIGR